MRGFTGILLGVVLLTVAACGGKRKHYHVTDEGLANARPYISSTAYAPVLKRCALASSGETCTLEELPVLGMEVESPGVADIMSRVVVSHCWMGERFAEVLERMPDDLLVLFSSITVVVIDDDIRPSYYSWGTGAIYLDPDYLWLTLEEEATISDKEDFRGEYIRRMAYLPVWRYVNGASASFDQGRSLASISVRTAQLLFHELAHATDRFPPAFFASVDRTQRIQSVIESLTPVAISTLLDQTYPLESQTMFDLAAILYGGATAPPAYLAITAEEVGHHFSSDGANDDYNYALPEEDVAMLFEEAMMKFHFGMDRDVGFTNAVNPFNCPDAILGWGMRNRLGVENVKIRAEWVVEQLLPNSDYSANFATFPEPRQFEPGVSWCDNRLSNTASEKSFFNGVDERVVDPHNLLPSGGAHPTF